MCRGGKRKILHDSHIHTGIYDIYTRMYLTDRFMCMNVNPFDKKKKAKTSS